MSARLALVPRPPVAGAGGGMPDPPRAPVESPDTLHSIAYARVLDLLGEGEIGGLVDGLKSVYLNDTPVMAADGTLNFKGVTYQQLTGTQAQAYVSGFPASESPTNVNTRVQAGAPVTRSIVNAAANYAIVTLGFPQLSYQDASSGDLTGNSVEMKIELQNAGAGYIAKWQQVVSGKAMSRYQRSVRIALPSPGPWDLRVTRITPEGVTSADQKQSWWDVLIEGVDEKLRYPNSAIIALWVDAAQFSSIPTRGYLIDGIKVRVPSNYNPVTRVYTGAWDGTFQYAASNNPAWVWYDLVTATRYGAGSYIDPASVDKWALYAIGQYCDALVPDGFGATEPRFTCNLRIETQKDAQEVIRDLASIFRAITYLGGNTVAVSQDAPAAAKWLFTQANVRDGRFTYQGSARRARHSVVMVTWNDPANRYRQAIEYIEDPDAIARYGYNETRIAALGCTSRGQASRAGKWLLETESRQYEAITFATGIEGAPVRPGDVFKVLDSARAGKRFGGRISSATTLAVTTDAPVTIEAAKTYTLDAMLADGSVGSAAVTNAAGTYGFPSIRALSFDGLTQYARIGNQAWHGGNNQPFSFAIRAKFDATDGTGNILYVSSQDDGAGVAMPYLTLEAGHITARVWNGVSLAAADPAVTSYGTVRRIVGTWSAANGLRLYVDGALAAANALANNYIGSGLTNRFFLGYGNAAGNSNQGFLKFVASDFAAWNRELTNAEAIAWCADTTPTMPTDGVKGWWPLDEAAGAAARDISGARNNAALFNAPAWISGRGTLNLATALASAPQAEAAWAITASNLAPTLWRAVTVAEKEDGYIEVTGLAQDDAKYNAVELGLKIEAPPTSVIDAHPGAVTALALSDCTRRTASGDIITVLTAAWLAPANPVGALTYLVEYRRAGENWQVWQDGRIETTVDIYPVLDSVTYEARITTRNMLGASSVPTSASRLVLGKSARPSDVTGFIATIEEFGIKLSWNAIPDRDNPDYEIRLGANYDAAGFFDSVNAVSRTYKVQTAGTYTFGIKGRDSSKNYSFNPTYSAVTITAPSIASAAAAIEGENLALTWTPTPGTWPIDRYRVYYGDVFATATLLDNRHTNSWRAKVAWGGARKFWVEPLDVADNAGTPYSVDTLIASPAVVTPSIEVIDNNVLLRWTDAKTALPIARYEIRKGASWAAGAVVAILGAATRFASPFENAAGRYTYWIAAYDSAENLAVAASITAEVAQPPDFILRSDLNSSWGGTFVNCAMVSGKFHAPIPVEDWATHFLSRAWATPQDQINAGYPIYFEPSTATASYEETIDYGVVLASSQITAALSYATLFGAVTVTPTISVKALVGDPWMNFPAGSWIVFATNFRYVKIRLDFTAAGGDDLIEATQLNIKLSSKVKSDGGMVNAVSTDVGGTQVNFNTAFVDVNSITLTPAGTVPRTAIYDFVDAPYPTGFKVLLYEAGNRVSGTVSWSVDGV